MSKVTKQTATLSQVLGRQCQCQCRSLYSVLGKGAIGMRGRAMGWTPKASLSLLRYGPAGVPSCALAGDEPRWSRSATTTKNGTTWVHRRIHVHSLVVPSIQSPASSQIAIFHRVIQILCCAVLSRSCDLTNVFCLVPACDGTQYHFPLA